RPSARRRPPPPPGPPRPPSLPGRAHQIRFGSCSLTLMPREVRRRASSPPCEGHIRAGSIASGMCRVFGCVAAEPVSIRHELLEADNPMIRQSEDHDSGWGMAVYDRAEGAETRLVRLSDA